MSARVLCTIIAVASVFSVVSAASADETLTLRKTAGRRQRSYWRRNRRELRNSPPASCNGI